MDPCADGEVTVEASVADPPELSSPLHAPSVNTAARAPGPAALIKLKFMACSLCAGGASRQAFRSSQTQVEAMVLLGPASTPDDALGTEAEIQHAVDGTQRQPTGADILSLLDRDPMPARDTAAATSSTASDTTADPSLALTHPLSFGGGCVHLHGDRLKEEAAHPVDVGRLLQSLG